jgi:hypothetical protein
MIELVQHLVSEGQAQGSEGIAGMVSRLQEGN